MDKNDPLKAILPIPDELTLDSIVPRPKTLRIVRWVSLVILAVIVVEMVFLWLTKNGRWHEAEGLKDILIMAPVLLAYVWLLSFSGPVIRGICGRLVDERDGPPWPFWQGQVLQFGWLGMRVLLLHLVLAHVFFAVMLGSEIVKGF